MSLSAGTRLGPYEVSAPLGAGGMGEVYRAKDARLAREVAVKVLPAAMAEDADRLRRFELEAKAAGGLNHPNILSIFDTGAHDGAPYVVSELLEGSTLRDKLADGALPPRKAVDWALQILRGLAAAHDRGIVHRDLKPENLFLVPADGDSEHEDAVFLKVLDFGLSKILDETEITETGRLLGSPSYMSPEQVRGQVADARSDIFSFGAVLYEMLSGRRTFKGDTAVDTMHAILREDPPELTSVDARLPTALDRIARRCLEKSPDERFRSANDVAFALEALSQSSASGPAVAAEPAPRGARTSRPTCRTPP